MIIDKETLFAQNTAVTKDAVVGGTVVDLVKTGKHYKLHGFLVVLIKEAFAAAGAIATAAIAAGGTGYTAEDVVTIGGGTGATVKVLTVNETGVAQTIQLLTAGSGYSAAATAAVTGGTGTGLTLLTTLVGSGTVPGTALEFQLVVADDVLLTDDPTVISSTGAIPLASLGLGAMFALPLPIDFSRRYVGVKAVPTGDFVAGKFDAFITMDVPQWY